MPVSAVGKAQLICLPEHANKRRSMYAGFACESDRALAPEAIQQARAVLFLHVNRRKRAKIAPCMCELCSTCRDSQLQHVAGAL